MKSRTLKYNFRGLDVRTNHLSRGEGTAQDCDNVRLDSSRNLINREDQVALNVPRSTAASPIIPADALPENTVILKVVEFATETGDWVLLCKVNILPISPTEPNNYRNKLYTYKLSDNTVHEMPGINSNTALDATYGVYNENLTPFDGKISVEISQNVLYWTATSNTFSSTTEPNLIAMEAKPSVYKFDGYQWGRAGTVSLTGTATGEDPAIPPVIYTLVFPLNIDAQSNIIFGNFNSVRNVFDDGVKDLQLARRFSSTQTEKYQAFAMEVDGAQLLGLSGTVNITEVDGAIPPIGAWVMYVNSAVVGSDTVDFISKWQITDYAAGVVTLDNRHRWDSSGWFLDDNPIDIALTDASFMGTSLAANYYSVSPDKDYKYIGLAVVYTSSHTPVPIIRDSTLSFKPQEELPLTVNFENCYDNQIFYGNFPDGCISLTQYQQSLVSCDDKFLYFSGVGLNFSIENNSPFDSFKVGSENLGNMTAVKGNETFLMASRERGTWYISGSLLTGNYRVQEYKSTEIGCSSPNAIIELSGSMMFPAPRGFYLAQQGAQMNELSDSIEPIFTEDYLGIDPDMSRVEAEIDLWREYIYFYVPSKNALESGIILAYSYYFNEWYKYSQLLPEGGIIVDKISRFLYICDGTDIYEETSDLSNASFSCKWLSNFHTMGDAGVEKKFVEMRAFTIGAEVDNTVLIRSYRNWDYSEASTDEEEEIDGIHIRRKFNSNRSYSMSMGFETEVGNKILFNGYEFSFDADQIEMRGR